MSADLALTLPANTGLPVAAVLPPLRQALETHGNAVLVAPPGAGKTTLVPLALAAWRPGRVVMLEPRRLAARAAAHRMAVLLDEPVGQRVGYQVRFEHKVGRRIEVVTEGILLRRLQSDPELEGVAAVIFDEFHERNLDGDLGLALCREVQTALRSDLALVAMSATLDGAAVARLLGEAPVVESAGRLFPVGLRWGTRPATREVPRAVADTVTTALAEGPGSVLAFLPGEAEIHRAAQALKGRVPADVDVHPLYGALPPGRQDRAIAPAPAGRRKVVLATSIAETSLTIDGITQVVDGGLARRPRFDPGRGMAALITDKVSRAEADQRAGRAGRLGPGVCWRLWREAEHGALAAAAPPEITVADLAPLRLALAAWGATPEHLPWLDPPPAPHWAQAGELLRLLGALDHKDHLTAHGRALAGFPLHPRLAHMILAAPDDAHRALACLVAALLSDRDPLRLRDPDLVPRVAVLLDPRAARDAGAAEGALSDIRRAARQWQRHLGVAGVTPAPAQAVGALVALAWPDRVAQQRGGDGRYRFAGGGGGRLDPEAPLVAARWLAVAEVSGRGADPAIRLAARLTRADIETVFADQVAWHDHVCWDDRLEKVKATRQKRFGTLVLAEETQPDPDPADVVAALLAVVARKGPSALPWTEAARRLQGRVAWLAAAEPTAGWPDLGEDTLLATLESWLAPFLPGATTLAAVDQVDLEAALKAILPWDLAERLDTAAPPAVTLPGGRTVPLRYTPGEPPVLAARLQDLFGVAETPRVHDDPVILHLLSPADRPLQVTRDLAGFWANTYAEVRKDMRGQYPRHRWPEDPLAAEPGRHRGR